MGHFKEMLPVIFQETSFFLGLSEDTVITKASHGASPLGSEDDGPEYQRTWLQWAIPEVPGDPLPKPQPPDPLGPQTPRPSPSLPSNPLRASPPPLSGSSARLLEAGLWQRPASASRRTRKGSLPLSAFHFPEVLGAVGRAGSKRPRLGIASPSPRPYPASGLGASSRSFSSAHRPGQSSPCLRPGISSFL